MKNRFTYLWIFMLLATALQAQIQTLSISGTVMNINTTVPIANHEVTIQIDSLYGMPYYNTTTTNSNGFYENFITFTPGMVSQGNVNVSTIDCNGSIHSQTLPYSPTILSLTANFEICADSTPTGCQSSFDYYTDSVSNLTYFYDQSTGNPFAWFWDFGDGAVSTEQNPVHAYAQAGNYFTTLTISTAGGCTSTSTQIVHIYGQPVGCQAVFTYSPNNPAYPNQIQFTDLSYGSMENWNWDFGDGTYSTEQNPIHTYANGGLYNVCLNIYSSDSSCNSTYCMGVISGNPGGPCQAYYNYLIEYAVDTITGIPNVTAMFFDQSSGNINSWLWNFGDGTSSSEQNPVHAFMPNSYYMVCLTIQGDSNCTDTYCDTIFTGMPVGCEASWYHYPIDTLNMLAHTFQFVNTSTGNYTQLMWDFGDGTYSTDQTPIHTFAPGQWVTCLTISNPMPPSGCSDAECQTIIVDSIFPCNSSFSYQVSNLTASFNGYLLNGQSATYAWNFGDPLYFGIGEGQNVTHTYSAPGLYSVTLTTTTPEGCTFCSVQQVLVGDSSNVQNIQGTVLAGNYIPTGIVFLLPTTSLWIWNAQMATIDSTGHYFFGSVLPGSYHILAVPFSVNGDTMAYLPTYYGDVIFWEQATIVTLGTAAPAYNINLVACNGINPGGGLINGNITTTGLKAGMSDVNILLLDEQDQPLVFDKSNAAGAFDFTTLAYGTYTIWAEMHGVTTIPVQVTLSEVNPTATVNLKLSGTSVMGIGDENSLIKSIGQIYPNPVTSGASLEITTLKPVMLQISIVDAMGRIVSTTTSTMNGNELINLNTQSLPSGIYTLLITGDDGSRMQRKLVKATR